MPTLMEALAFIHVSKGSTSVFFGTGAIKQTKRFRFMVIRVAFYGFGLLLPLGLIGTVLPSFIPGRVQLVAELAYLGLSLFYFAMNLTLTRSVFINPWPKK